jgi:hypothetical protein
MSGGMDDPDRFLGLVALVSEVDGRLTPIQASLITAALLGAARDSRTFARLLGLPHALVLRELNALAESGDVLRIVSRDERTLRTRYEPGRDAERFAALFDRQPSA